MKSVREYLPTVREVIVLLALCVLAAGVRVWIAVAIGA